jgi:alpha-tubulin suppressor-like RCC1 family protein
MALYVRGQEIKTIFLSESECIDQLVSKEIWSSGLGGIVGDGSVNTRTVPFLTCSACAVTWDWKDSSGGYCYTLALKSKGTLWSWGVAGNHLGTSTAAATTSAVCLNTVNDNWAYAKAGYYVSYGIQNDGSLWAWGTNTCYVFGNGTLTSNKVPTQVGTAKDWKKIATGVHSAVGLKSNGSIWSWGKNTSGQLGHGDTVVRSTPTQIGSSCDWKDVYGGDSHYLALKSDGTLWAWGSNTCGELGLNCTVDKSTPTQVDGVGWLKLARGGLSSNWSAAIKSDGTLWAWGLNTSGQLGDGTLICKSSPIQIGTETNWKSLSMTVDAAGAIKTDGTAWSWGNNFCGKLGHATGDTSGKSSPVQVYGNASNWSYIDVSYRTTQYGRLPGDF